MNKILLVIMDGMGFSKTGLGDAISMANTPTIDMLLKNYPNTRLKAHGSAVGLPCDDDMGNSEVGHNALGCGQIYSQGAKLVNESLSSGKIYHSKVWTELVNNCKYNHTSLHFIGLLSDGNVHSNIDHLISMIKNAKDNGIHKVYCHILLDGRDVPATSALEYVDKLETIFAELNDQEFQGKIASGGGRMKITMDRYQADWMMVELGWLTHVQGIGEQFTSAREAITKYREKLGVDDQYLPPFVIGENGIPVGKILDGDSVILFNFRGDRAIELSMAFEYDEFPFFNRGPRPKVKFAGMLQYDGDLNLPNKYLVDPPDITNTLSELLIENGIKQYAVSETQKYGHVTYFWNGNKSKKFSEELETFTEIQSDKIAFDERPWMKSSEITDDVMKAIQSGKYNFIRCNYPNGDMVGHTGNINATIISVESVDLAIARLLKIVEQNDFTLIITADHGNADEMLELNKNGELQIRTAHSLNKVPFIIYDKTNSFKIKDGEFGLANVAPTIATIFGLNIPDCWEESMIQ